MQGPYLIDFIDLGSNSTWFASFRIRESLATRGRSVFLDLPSQTKLGVHLLRSSSLHPLVTSPNSETNEDKEEDEASEEDVGPPTQDLSLDFFLLAIGDGRFLALVGGNINDAHPRLNESVVSLVLIGYQHDVSGKIMVECAAFDTVKGRQAM